MAIDFSRIKFFVEGDGDRVFVRDILKLWYQAEFNVDQLKEVVEICDGYTNLRGKTNFLYETRVDKKREGGVNLVLFDADFSGWEENHGYQNKLTYLNKQKTELETEFEIYLFPDNSSDGTLESLLETCIPKEHQHLLDCWHNFESCVKGKDVYNIPANKSKIYTYLECLHGNSKEEKKKVKDPYRNYTNADHWDLRDWVKNKYLIALKTFLDTHLGNNIG